MVVIPIVLFPFRSPYCLAITHLALWLINGMSKLVEYLILGMKMVCFAFSLAVPREV